MRAAVIAAVLITLAGASDVLAQVTPVQWPPIQEPPTEWMAFQPLPRWPVAPRPLPRTHCTTAAIGLAFGPAFNHYTDGTGAVAKTRKNVAPAAVASVEFPGDRFDSAKAEVATMSWRFRGDLYDNVRITAITVSRVKEVPEECAFPLRMRAGLGLGFYLSDFERAGITEKSGGLHAFAGTDIRVSPSFDLTLDMVLDAILGPDQGPTLLLPIRFTAGTRLRF